MTIYLLCYTYVGCINFCEYCWLWRITDVSWFCWYRIFRWKRRLILFYSHITLEMIISACARCSCVRTFCSARACMRSRDLAMMMQHVARCHGNAAYITGRGRGGRGFSWLVKKRIRTHLWCFIKEREEWVNENYESESTYPSLGRDEIELLK